jgi:hypothetical protein
MSCASYNGSFVFTPVFFHQTLANEAFELEVNSTDFDFEKFLGPNRQLDV